MEASAQRKQNALTRHTVTTPPHLSLSGPTFIMPRPKFGPHSEHPARCSVFVCAATVNGILQEPVMAETVVLVAQDRSGRGTNGAKKLRKRGLIPGVVYGHKEA